jgi:hypothetical protein
MQIVPSSNHAGKEAGEILRQILRRPKTSPRRSKLLRKLSYGQRQAVLRLETEHSWLIDDLKPLLALPGLWQIDPEWFSSSIDCRYQEVQPLLVGVFKQRLT